MIKTTGLKEEMEKIARLGATFDEELMDELNELGLEWRDDTRENINVVSGDLRRSTVFEGAEKHGKEFVIAVSNNMEYAEHYEYGHRQEVGRFVPAIGKRLVKSYVKGQYTFRTSRQRAKAKLPERIRAAISRAEARLK